MPPIKKVYVRIGVCYNRGAFKDSPFIFFKNAPVKKVYVRIGVCYNRGHSRIAFSFFRRMPPVRGVCGDRRLLYRGAFRNYF